MRNMPLDVHDGMDVVDVNGDKVGTIKDVQQYGAVGTGIGSTGDTGYAHVSTGILGMGKDLYIPLDSFRDCTDETCYLSVSKDEIDSQGWDRKPTSFS